MSVYLVTWDLNREKANYSQARQKLIKHLGGYDHTKDSGLDSVWFIRSSLSASKLDADIRSHMDTNDRLIVTKLVDGQYQGWLSTDVWDGSTLESKQRVQGNGLDGSLNPMGHLSVRSLITARFR